MGRVCKICAKKTSRRRRQWRLTRRPTHPNAQLSQNSTNWTTIKTKLSLYNILNTIITSNYIDFNSWIIIPKFLKNPRTYSNLNSSLPASIQSNSFRRISLRLKNYKARQAFRPMVAGGRSSVAWNLDGRAASRPSSCRTTAFLLESTPQTWRGEEDGPNMTGRARFGGRTAKLGRRSGRRRARAREGERRKK